MIRGGVVGHCRVEEELQEKNDAYWAVPQCDKETLKSFMS